MNSEENEKQQEERGAGRGGGTKRARAGGTSVQTLTLDYSLAELPSAQHRAGLAGLVLMVQWLEQQRSTKGTCKLARLDEYGATLELDREGLGCLLDETYAAREEETEERRPRKKKSGEEVPPKRVEERIEKDKNGKEVKKLLYVYSTVVPKAPMLESLDRTTDGLWIKLWRDMMWSVVRGVPTTREPFEVRARGERAKDVDEIWNALVKPLDYSIDLPSTYYLGAQAQTGDNVPFRDRARYQFLLHFWPYAAQIYVPAVVDVQENKRTFVGYALAIPDVGLLKSFCEELRNLLAEREDDRDGYRPKGAVVDVAVESALDFARRLRERISRREGERATADMLLGVEVVHAEKEGNNVRVRSVSRLEPENAMIDEYLILRKTLRDPFFRRTRLLNLVEGKPWYSGFDKLAETLPYESQFIGSDKFRYDARASFEAVMGRSEEMDEDKVREDSVDNNDGEERSYEERTKAPRSLEELVYKIVQRYVLGKVESKKGLTWEASKKQGEDKIQEYNEARSKVAKDAFLAVRSRTGADFVQYFAGTICSVSQRMKPEEYKMLADALKDRTDDVRTLTLLALSAQG